MKQHFLPEVYLKEFRNREGKLHCLDYYIVQFGRKVFDEPKYPAEVCRAKDFYTIQPVFKTKFPHMTGLPSLHIETSFHPYESEYPKLIAKIKKHQNALIIKDANLLIYVLVDLKIRNNYFREKIVPKAHKNIVENDLNELKKEIELAPSKKLSEATKDQFVSVIEKIQNDFQASNENHAQSHLSSIALRRGRGDEIHLKIIKHLLQYQWIVYTSNDQFITTDNPGFSYDTDKRVIQNTKFDENVIFFFPLTPSLCLSINTSIEDGRYKEVKAQKVIKYVRATSQLLNFINDSHSFHLSRYIFSSKTNMINEIADKINCKHFT